MANDAHDNAECEHLKDECPGCPRDEAEEHPCPFSDQLGEQRFCRCCSECTHDCAAGV